MKTPIPIVNGFYDTVALIEEGLALHSRGGLPPGQRTGWDCLDPYYSVVTGQVTLITGVPGSGKSEFLDALLVNLAEADPMWTFAIYSPENAPIATHLAKLTEKVIGKPFGHGPTERLTRGEYLQAATWVGQHFRWINSANKGPLDLINLAVERIRGEDKLGIVLDPWNTLEHDRRGMSETDYISLVLSEVMSLARETDIHVWLVVHPTKIPRNKDGTRPVPTPYDISGSAHWYNRLDNIITVHRDQGEQSQEVEIHVQKVRHKHVGHPGLVTLKYDKVCGRYFEAPTIADPFTRQPERYKAPKKGA